MIGLANKDFSIIYDYIVKHLLHCYWISNTNLLWLFYKKLIFLIIINTQTYGIYNGNITKWVNLRRTYTAVNKITVKKYMII